YFDFGKWIAPKKLKSSVSNSYSKLAFGIGVFIICANCLCGMFSIDSYPFSAYPKYAAIIPDSIKIINFDARKANDSVIDVHAIGQKNRFRWENYGWLEYNLIRDYENGQDITSRLKDYWQIWEKHNPELRACQTVHISIVERPLTPERSKHVKVIAFIDTWSRAELDSKEAKSSK